MKEGYKDTQLGMIPEDWSISTVDHATVDHKQGYYTKERYVKSGIKLVRVTDLKNPKIDFSDMPSLIVSEKDYHAFKIELGDFIFARSGAIGRYGVVEWIESPAIFGSYLIRFKFNQKVLVNRFFGYFYESFLCNKQLNAITQGNANININAENIKSLKIPLPPFLEQLKIASILSTVDDKIDAINDRIAKAQQFKNGLMQRLLTRGIGHTKFKNSPLGQIPESWEVVKLGDYQKLMTNGFVGTATPFYVNSDGILYIQGYNVHENKFRYTGIKYISHEFHEKHRKSHLKEGDLLTVQTGHIGTTVVVPKELEGSNCHALIITRLKREFFDPRFIAYFINSEKGKERINIISIGSTLAHINVADFVKFLVPIPPLEEQERILLILSNVDEKLDVLQEKRTEYSLLKNGLMQQLLTGKIRVKV